jgi:hypothetical protein
MPSGNLAHRLLLGVTTVLAASASLVATAMLAPAASASTVPSAAPHCGGKQIDHYTVLGVGPVDGQNMGSVSLFYDGSSNCAYFERSAYDRGHPLPIQFSMQVGKLSAHDNGDYLSYAGPLTLQGRGECVTLAVRERVNQHMLVDWRVGPVHCGRMTADG